MLSLLILKSIIDISVRAFYWKYSIGFPSLDGDEPDYLFPHTSSVLQGQYTFNVS
jgi:hypothetical protein